MKASEIRQLSVKEIRDKIAQEQLELTKLRLAHAVTPMPNSNDIRSARRTIARFRTILTEKSSPNKNA
jgi:large subunit ribosomal protein L29